MQRVWHSLTPLVLNSATASLHSTSGCHPPFCPAPCSHSVALRLCPQHTPTLLLLLPPPLSPVGDAACAQHQHLLLVLKALAVLLLLLLLLLLRHYRHLLLLVLCRCCRCRWLSAARLVLFVWGCCCCCCSWLLAFGHGCVLLSAAPCYGCELRSSQMLLLPPALGRTAAAAVADKRTVRLLLQLACWVCYNGSAALVV